MKTWRRILLVLAFAPLLATGVAVDRFAVETPNWDDLERATLLAKWKDGTLDFAYLFSLHIEHRILVPRLVTLANAVLFGGTHRAENFFSFAMLCAAALAVHLLLRRSLPDRPLAVLGLTFLANLLLLSPLQWENLLWAIQTAFVIPPACLAFALVALQARIPLAARFAVCAACAAIATLSFSHGLVLWPAIFGAALLRRDLAPPRGRALFLAAWVVAAAAVLLPYFTFDEFRNRSDHSYVPIGEQPHGLAIGSAPERVVKIALFFGSMLGSPVSRNTIVPSEHYSVYIGWALFAAFGLAALYWLRRWRDADLFDRALPWFVLGGYGVLACGAAALGRSFTNRWTYALISHYATLPSYLVLSLVVLGALFAEDLRRRLPSARTTSHALLERGPAFLAGLLLASQVGAWVTGMHGMRAWREARLEGRAVLLFLRHFEPGSISLVRLDGVPEVLHRLARRLDDTGFLRPPLLPDLRLASFAIDESPLSSEAARIERAGTDANDLWLRGFAWLPEAGRRADAVLVSFRDESGERQVAGLAETRGFPHLYVPEADHLFNEVRRPGVDDLAAFSGNVALARLPARDPVELEVWVLDSDRLRVRRFAQGLRVRSDAGRTTLEVDPLPRESDADE